MPGPFTHIYAARRVADILGRSEGDSATTPDFIRAQDGSLKPEQLLDAALVKALDPRQCAAIMTKWPKFTAVGAIGPDLFFWLQDYNQVIVPCDEIMLAMSLLYYLDDQGRLDDPYDGLIAIVKEINDTWASILRFIVKIDQIWQKFVTVWNETIGPILDKAGQVIDDLTGQLFSTLGDAFTELKNDLVALAAEEVLTEGDIFAWFSLKMRNGYDEQAFVWSDMMHYRRTSAVPERLIVHAREMLNSKDALTHEHGEQLLAFALGWICHVGTDAIAHSFVNEQCGGPFRTHWQRHHVIENHIDAWNYQCTKKGGPLPEDPFVGYQDSYQSIGDSALYFAVQIPQKIDELPDVDAKQGAVRQPLPDDTDQASRDLREKLLDTDGELPLWLAETIVQVFIEVYADPKEGGNPDVQGPLGEGTVPHPRNLMGQPFQDALHAGPDLIEKWLRRLGIDNVGIAMDDLRKIVAPDPTRHIPEGFPLPWEVMTAYRFMLSWFKRQYATSFKMDQPQRPHLFTPPLSDITNLLGPPDFSGVSTVDDPLSKTCVVVLAALDWVFKELENTAQLLYDIAKTVASALTWPERMSIYYCVISPTWHAAEQMRMVLVHLGYLMPQSEARWDNGELKHPNEVDEALITLGHSVDSAFAAALAAVADPLGNLDTNPALTKVGVRDVMRAKNPWLPVRLTPGEKPAPLGLRWISDVDEFQRPWAFPDRNNNPKSNEAGNYLEGPLTVAGPYATDTLPHEMFGVSSPISNDARVLFQDAGCPADTDLLSQAFVRHELDEFGQAGFHGTNPLGDPVVFSAYLIGQIANNPHFVSNFNLDADRGYGYLCWDWVRRETQPGETTPKDGQFHTFSPPVVWPEGAGESNRSAQWPPVPVPVGTEPVYQPEQQLHYPGRDCKLQGGGPN
jgi:hypothetical protein